jgi:hypothetical protein
MPMVGLSWMDVIQHDYLSRLWIAQVAAITNAFWVGASGAHNTNVHFQQEICPKLNLSSISCQFRDGQGLSEWSEIAASYPPLWEHKVLYGKKVDESTNGND